MKPRESPSAKFTSTSNLVQILHSGGNHWITVSIIGATSPSTVREYDSLGKAIPLDTKKQIVAILHSPDDEIKLENANVQVHINVKCNVIICH